MSTARTEKWWRPVWVGLVADPGGMHVRKLGTAGWMLLYLILHADPATGVLVSYSSKIAARIGLPLRTVQRWLRRLEGDGYVAITSADHAPRIRVLRWKSLRARASLGAPRVALGARRARSDAGRTGTIPETASNHAGERESPPNANRS